MTDKQKDRASGALAESDELSKQEGLNTKFEDFNRRTFLKGSLGGVGVSLVGFSGLASGKISGESSSAAARDCTTLPPNSKGGIDIDSIKLKSITESVGLLEPLKGMYGHAAAWGDVTGNGWLDLFVGTFADRPREDYLQRGSDSISPDRFLMGGPDGFRVAESFPEMYGRTSGAAFVDLDNDGDLDLVLARNDRGEYQNNEVFNAFDNQTIVLENDGGEFSRVTALDNGGVVDLEMNARTIVPFDYNGDGRLDLFIVDDHYDLDGNSRLFRNEGGFEFSDATEEAGLPSGITGLGAREVDFTGNGWPDLLVSGSLRKPSWPEGTYSVQSARLFLNEGGTFHEVDASEFQLMTASWADESAGIAIGDLTRNGRQDVILGHHIHSDSLLEPGIPAARVYLNRGLNRNGVPKFDEVTQAAGIPDVHTRSPGVHLVDFNNNGWSDIHIAVTRIDGTQPTVLEHRGVDGDIPQFSTPYGLGDERESTENWWQTVVGIPRYWAVMAPADYNRDGRMESLDMEWWPGLPSQLFYNEGHVGNWLSVDVVPMAEAIGTEIEIFCPGRLGDTDSLIATESITATSGYDTGITSDVHFGLGQAPAVDIRATLPHGDGIVEQRGVRANQHLTIKAE